MTRLAWGRKVDAEFRRAVVATCKALDWSEAHASWLMACIAFETGETFDPAIRNAAGSGATGLIQFMPKTAQGLGTTTEALGIMTAPEQMKFVQKYLAPYASRVRTLSDMYMAILAPKAVGQPDGYVLYSDGAPYRMNSPLDTNSDGKITKAEAARFVRVRLDKGILGDNWTLINWNQDSVLTLIASIEGDLARLKSLIGE